MTYQEFKENVTVIQNRLGSNVKVTIQDDHQNNDTHYDGLNDLIQSAEYIPNYLSELFILNSI